VLIEEVVGLCINDLDKNNIKVKVDLAKNIPDVVIDDVQIEQVLLNLFRNSIEALRDLKQEKKRHLSVQSYLTNLNLVEIRIKDNGIGINEAFQKKILSPFYSTKQEGMGIGLSLSRLIIEAHNGVLYFNSKPEKGCTFYFTLPIKGDLVDSK
jgi:signal transduction histidine kinase